MTSASQKKQELFPVAGVGASAGGLQTLRQFLEHVPADCGIAIVVVIHLSPEHDSHLAELLQSHTAMPVTQVNEATLLQPDHVYVIPPKRHIATIDSHLHLTSPQDAGVVRAPIDHFLRALARSHRDQAIAVLLSGSGSDGTVGMKDIAEAGGLVVAQDPHEASFGGMPQSAIATGLVDDVLPVAQIGARLRAFVEQGAEIEGLAEEKDLGEDERALLQRIFVQLRTVVGHDFSRYKRGAILRRIRRRMQLRGVSTLQSYLETLRAEPAEVRALYKDLLIVVTNFFREPETYETVAQRVLPQLFEEAGAGRPIRVWVPGCATGEEAYSLAILLLERAGQMQDPPPLQIFATDISRDALRVARNALYTTAIEADVSPQRLERFFKKEEGGYRVRDHVRQLVLFAQHSLLRDPPFSRVDLISCRNVLIYLQRELQSQLLELFHYALRRDGYLFLSSSEGVNDAQLFAPVSSRHSLYRRQEALATPSRMPELPLSVLEDPPQPRFSADRERRSQGAHHHQLVEKYAPPSILVDDDYTVLHISRHAGRYLRFAGGETTDNVLQLAREELRTQLATLLHGALSQGQSARAGPVSVAFNGESRMVTVFVQPVEEVAERRQALVFFLESPQAREPERILQPDDAQNRVVRELQEELADTRRQLRTTVEEYEASKEEMMASNEELQSINEELRSMTEELETSKEELQSMNEELLAVNEENQHKVAELSQLSSDLQNLLAATEIATIFLDRQLRIQRFTPAAADIFNMRYTDRDRPLSHLSHRLANYDGLMEDSRRVLQNLEALEREVHGDDGRHFLLRLRPYHTTRGEIKGLVITLVDISALHEAELALASSRERYRLLVESTKEYAMFTMDVEGHILSWNQGAQRILGFAEDEAVGQHGALIFTPEDRQAGVPQREMQRAREDGQALDERWHVRKDGSRFWASGVMTSLWQQDRLEGYAKVLRDNTQRKEAEDALRERERQLAQLTATLEERVQQRTLQVRQLAGELVGSEQKVRQRISQVLHDNLQQLLYALEMQLVLFREDVAAALPERALEELDQMAESISGALNLTRRLTVELSPPILRGEGLADALQWLVKHMKEIYKLDVALYTETSVRLEHEEQRILLFQVVRELLFNIVKHAAVREATIRLQNQEDNLRIVVSDRGAGFDVEAKAAAERSGFGLFHARERVELFGGSFEIASQPGEGTTVTMSIPQSLPGAPKPRE